MSDSINNYITVSPADLSATVKVAYELNKPLMVWGPPGV